MQSVNAVEFVDRSWIYSSSRGSSDDYVLDGCLNFEKVTSLGTSKLPTIRGGVEHMHSITYHQSMHSRLRGCHVLQFMGGSYRI